MLSRKDDRLLIEKSVDYQFEKSNLLPESLTRSDLKMPQLSEVDVVRHYTNLSQKNYGITLGIYPLGSCTMKYNPYFTEIAAGYADNNFHPYSDESLIQGSLEIMYRMEGFLNEIGGMTATTLQPSAGAHGEFLSMMMIRSYFEERGQERSEVLIPDSAHGTNPASAIMVGFTVVEVPSTSKGMVDPEALKERLSDKTAAIMLTNPNTLGLFEEDIVEIAEAVHGAGGLLYYDGANLNGIMGKTRPGDMGFDCMHFNLHKTFATPHGGGGPGSGPVGVRPCLEPYLPIPRIEFDGEKYRLNQDRPKSIGKIRMFYGNYPVIVKALAYTQRLGSEGLTRVSEYAVLNANYMMKLLQDTYQLNNPEVLRKHEFVVSPSGAVKTLNVAKRLIDYGVHPPTVYFPLIVPEALMIEPTETESKKEMDSYMEILKLIAKEAVEDPEKVEGAPIDAPTKKIDEVTAARKPRLTWREVI